MCFIEGLLCLQFAEAAWVKTLRNQIRVCDCFDGSARLLPAIVAPRVKSKPGASPVKFSKCSGLITFGT